jgi:hypothetical protein
VLDMYELHQIYQYIELNEYMQYMHLLHPLNEHLDLIKCCDRVEREKDDQKNNI